MRPPDSAALLTHFRSRDAVRPALVGCERELGELTSALDAAARGEGRSFLVAGEAGIGKTRLADALSEAADRRGARAAWGRCWEAGGAPPHWPWVQVVRSLTDGLDGDALAGALGPHAAGVLALAPELRGRLTDPPPPAPARDGESARFAAWDATVGFLGRAAVERPLLVVLDDVHVADLPSLLLLRFVARSLRGRRLLVVATMREHEARARAGVAELVDEIAREGGRIGLRGLGEAGVATLAGTHAGQRPPGGFARELRSATDGNPFWVEEIVRLRLADEPANPWATPCPVPAEIGATLASRIRALPASARELLAVAAVVGREWDSARVRALAGGEDGELAEAVACAADAGLLQAHFAGFERHRFAHVLVRDALYETLPAARREELHGALAEALERDAPDDVAPLAHHFAAAGAGATRQAHLYARAAGDAAAAGLAFEEAAQHFERALAVGDPSPADVCDLLLALGEARMRAGDTEGARAEFVRAAETARALDDPERLAAAALGFGSGGETWANGAVDEELAALLEEALAGLPDDPTALRALVLARLADALIYAHDWVRTDELSSAAVAAARAAGDPLALMRSLAARLLAIMRPATLEQRLALADELIELARRTGSREHELDALAWQIAHALELGDGAALDAHVARFRAIAEELRQPHMLWGARLHETMRAILHGRLDDAERLAHEAITVAEGVVPLAAAMFAVQMLWIRREQGRLAEVEPGLRAFLEAFPAVRAWRTTWAGILLETGAEREARAELERIAAENFLIEPDDYEWPSAMTVLGEAFARLGDADRCALLYDQLLPYADRTVVVSIGAASGGPIARPLGLMAEAVGDLEAAERHFEQSLSICERLNAPAFAARTRLEYGRMLLRAGDTARACGLLSAAAEAAEPIGMEIAGQARALLAEHAESPSALAFRRAGDVWELGDPTAPLRLRDAKGLRYLAELLRHPGIDLAAADLAGGTGKLGDAGPALDAAAKEAYRRRVEDLRSEQDDAERWNDPERAARAQAELDAIGHQLAGAVGLGGRDRKTASPAERARISVTKAIKTSINRITNHDPELGDYLKRAIQTGTYCKYDPPKRDRIDWQL